MCLPFRIFSFVINFRCVRCSGVWVSEWVTVPCTFTCASHRGGLFFAAAVAFVRHFDVIFNLWRAPTRVDGHGVWCVLVVSRNAVKSWQPMVSEKNVFSTSNPPHWTTIPNCAPNLLNPNELTKISLKSINKSIRTQIQYAPWIYLTLYVSIDS